MLQTWSDLLAETTRRELIERVHQGELVRIASGMYVDGLDLSGRPEQIHFVKFVPTRSGAHMSLVT